MITKKLRKTTFGILVLVSTIIFFSGCATAESFNKPSRSIDYLPNRLVLLEDGCPKVPVEIKFRVSCRKLDQSARKGTHAQLLLDALILASKNLKLSFGEVVFIDVTDSENTVTAYSLIQGANLALSLSPNVVNVSYSIPNRNADLEEVFNRLTRNNVKIFASFSNLYLEEESYPAMFSSVVGVKIGQKFSRENDGSLVLKESFVKQFSTDRPSTSIASVLAAAAWLNCPKNDVGNFPYFTVCT
ncbi:MAG: hypothetical protein Q4P66_10050 [Actinomycetaceae bacterium]|nr:hypothetical protein [Actinomycetaceae bacterium]